VVEQEARKESNTLEVELSLYSDCGGQAAAAAVRVAVTITVFRPMVWLVALVVERPKRAILQTTSTLVADRSFKRITMGLKNLEIEAVITFPTLPRRVPVAVALEVREEM
jgi:hypothetical protein